MVGARVDEETLEMLRFAQAFTDTDSMQDLLAPVIERFAKEFSDNPEVQVALAEKRKFQGRVSGTVKDLHRRGTEGAS
jgi:hypothetical protein